MKATCQADCGQNGNQIDAGRSLSTDARSNRLRCPSPQKDVKREASFHKSTKSKRSISASKRGHKEPTRSIASFFPTAVVNESGDASSSRCEAPTSLKLRLELDDLVEDGPLLDSSHTTSIVEEAGSLSTSAEKHVTSAGRQFIWPTNSQSQWASDSHSPNVAQQTWSEKYAPSSLEETAVNKRKVNEVRAWLERALSRDSKDRLLVLKGPPGSGKSTTLELLAKEMNLEATEWKNPTMSQFSEEHGPISAQFHEFLSRGRKYKGLNIDSRYHSWTRHTAFNRASDSSPLISRRVVVVEDFPSTLIHSLPALQTFRASILDYISAERTTASSDTFTPLVIIMTEDATHASTSHDGLTAHRLLGFEILNHLAASVIEFNPIATSFLTKALDRILTKEAKRAGKKGKPGSGMIKHVNGAGDIRNAINSLEFRSINYQYPQTTPHLQSEPSNDTGNTVHKPLDGYVDAPDVTAHRESSLGLFHAVGKVIYNKRDEREGNSAPASHRLEPNKMSFAGGDSQRSIQAFLGRLIADLGVDTGTFIATLHENFVPSCNGSSFVESISGCLEAMSESDLLRPRFGAGPFSHASQTRSPASQTDLSRNEELAFHVSVGGMLHALPYPVKRTNQPNASTKGKEATLNPFRLQFPESLRLLRQAREIGELARYWTRDTYQKDPRSQRGAWVHDEGQLIQTVSSRSLQDVLLVYLPYYAMIRKEDDPRQQPIIRSITEMHGCLEKNFDAGAADLTEAFKSPSRRAEAQARIAIKGFDGNLNASSQNRLVEHSKRGASAVNSGSNLYLLEDEIEDD